MLYTEFNSDACISVFFTSYLGLASLMLAGRGGLTLGVGGGSLVGNVARLASTEGAVGTRYQLLIIIKRVSFVCGLD